MPSVGPTVSRVSYTDAHGRWMRKLPTHRDTGEPAYREERWWQQRGGCAFYHPISGRLGEDWGACSNEDSPLDARLVFEHDGCEAFVKADPRSAPIA